MYHLFRVSGHARYLLTKSIDSVSTPRLNKETILPLQLHSFSPTDGGHTSIRDRDSSSDTKLLRWNQIPELISRYTIYIGHRLRYWETRQLHHTQRSLGTIRCARQRLDRNIGPIRIACCLADRKVSVRCLSQADVSIPLIVTKPYSQLGQCHFIFVPSCIRMLAAL